MVILATLVFGAAGAAADVTLPSTPTTALPAAAPPSAAAPALAPAAAPAPQAAPALASPALQLGLRTLRPGMSGSDVRDLQRELRRRGRRLASDGAYGPATLRAVKALQRHLGLRQTGVADPALFRRIGIQTRAVASGSAPAAAPAKATTAPAPISSGAVGQYLKAFPVAGKHTYYDDFGEPRGQGPHQGNDIMAARDTPVVAVADGVIDRLTRTETGLGGIWIWMHDDAGNTYYYCHLDHIVDGLQPGDRVSVGQQIGAVGNTGDARYGATHLHFELHPGGGPAVSPFTELRTVDPTPASATTK